MAALRRQVPAVPHQHLVQVLEREVIQHHIHRALLVLLFLGSLGRHLWHLGPLVLVHHYWVLSIESFEKLMCNIPGKLIY